MPTGFNPPLLFLRALDHEGLPAPGAKLYHRVAGTELPKAIYYDAALTSECPQPLVADAEGCFPQFFLEGGAYRFVLFDQDGVQLRPPEDPIYGAGSGSFIPFPTGSGFLFYDVDTDAYTWIEKIESEKIAWPLTPPVGRYVSAPSSLYRTATGGNGYGSDTLTATASNGYDTRHGIELAHSGSNGTVRVGDIDGTRLEYADDVGGAGIDAHGIGVHAFDGLVSLELDDAEAPAIRPATIGVSGRIGATDAATFRSAIDAQAALTNPVTGTGATGQIAVWTSTGVISGDAGLTYAFGSFVVGDGVTASSAYMSLKAPSAYGALLRMYDGSVLRARFGRSGSNLVIDAYDVAGAGIDSPWSMALAAGGTIVLGGNGATKRDVNFTGNLQAAGTKFLSSGRALAVVSAQVSALAHGTSGEYRMVASDYLGNVAYRTAAQARGDIGAAASTDLASYQPIDADLSAIATLSTTTFGRSLLTQADAAAVRTTSGALAAAEKGAANGVAPLGADSKIASTYLPSYVDDVLEYANLASFPATGESGKIYVALDTNKTYRWSGSAYVVISETLALGETSSTAYRGDRGATAYTHSQATGNPHGTTFAQIANTPTTLAGYGIADAQPFDSDLTAIAALSTTTFGRSLLTQADAAAARTTLGAASSKNCADSTLAVDVPCTATTSYQKIHTTTIPAGTITTDDVSGYRITLGFVGTSGANLDAVQLRLGDGTVFAEVSNSPYEVTGKFVHTLVAFSDTQVWHRTTDAVVANRSGITVTPYTCYDHYRKTSSSASDIKLELWVKLGAAAVSTVDVTKIIEPL